MKQWLALSDRELMTVRLQDLELDVEGELLLECLAVVRGELGARGFGFEPHVWLSDEWFCPDGVPGFAIPFYLAHQRLQALERRQMEEVEGGTRRSFLRLVRHETGHAIDNAYRLRSRERRVELFGSSEIEYPDSYAPHPYSRKFVRHLELGYAQCHPDDDFAETFAVWLDPASRWRQRYAGWPALAKLVYMDELMGEQVNTRPKVANRREPDALSTLSVTLGEHYRERRKKHKVNFARRYDRDLRRVFGTRGRAPGAAFLHRHRTSLRSEVAQGTGTRRYIVDRVLADWIARARALKLRLYRSEKRTRAEVVTLLRLHVASYMRQEHYRITV